MPRKAAGVRFGCVIMRRGIHHGYMIRKALVSRSRNDRIPSSDHSVAMSKPTHHLRAWREFRKLTQEQLAERVGTTKGVISHLETEKRDLSLKWLLKLAPALNTKPGFLIDHDPSELDSDILEIWADVPEANRSQVRAIIKTFRRATGGA